jgi:hypothetical protein
VAGKRLERRLALQLPPDAAGGAGFELRVALTSRRALQCELVRHTCAAEGGAEGATAGEAAVLSCTMVDLRARSRSAP